MGLLAAGKNIVCVQTVECQWCGTGRANKGAIYMCEEIGEGGFFHRITCATEGCDGFVLTLKGKTCCYCTCCFKPLDDGDRSLVQDEEENPYDTPAPPVVHVKETA